MWKIIVENMKPENDTEGRLSWVVFGVNTQYKNIPLSTTHLRPLLKKETQGNERRKKKETRNPSVYWNVPLLLSTQF